VHVVFFLSIQRTDAVVKDMFQIHVVDCEQFGSEGVESKLFELSDGESVALPSSYTPTTHRSSGVNIIYEDRRLQPVAACIMCVFTGEDAQLAASAGAIPIYVTLFSILPLATSTSASGNNFGLQLCSAFAPSNLESQRILGRL
jgi:hypothetical protein